MSRSRRSGRPCASRTHARIRPIDRQHRRGRPRCSAKRACLIRGSNSTNMLRARRREGRTRGRGRRPPCERSSRWGSASDREPAPGRRPHPPRSPARCRPSTSASHQRGLRSSGFRRRRDRPHWRPQARGTARTRRAHVGRGERRDRCRSGRRHCRPSIERCRRSCARRCANWR